MEEETTTFTSTWKQCSHHTGWFSSIETFWGKKKFFWCDLCHEPIKLKDLTPTQ